MTGGSPGGIFARKYRARRTLPTIIAWENGGCKAKFVLKMKIHK